MKQKNRWTDPAITPKNPSAQDMGKTWRVRFDFYHNGIRHAISRKSIGSEQSLNEIKNFKKRVVWANAMCKELKNRLQRGWNPVTDTYPDNNLVTIQQLSNFSFRQAMEFAFKQKEESWRGKSSKDYKGIKKYLIEAANEIGLADDPIKDFRRAHFRLILDEVVAIRELSPSGFNKYRSALSTFLSTLMEYDVVDANYMEAIRQKKVKKGFAHIPPNVDQRLLIVDRIKREHRSYYRFLSLIYGCALRPVEITRIRIYMLDKIEGVLRLPGDITKNGDAAVIPVPNWVMGLLSEMNLHNYDEDCFLFGGFPNTYMPGKKQMGVNTSNTTWRTIVKVGLGLDIDQYSLKKLSGDDMVRLQRREGVSDLLSLPQSLMRHGSSRQTEDYVTAHKEIVKEVIQQHMPEL